MYHVAGTGTTILILYIISYIFCRIGYYPLSYHKKFWNSILALAFIVAAIAGILMALQITYKWDIPSVKTILKWHVEFGIGMAVTGLLHFIWHLSYFVNIISGENKEDDKKADKMSFRTVPHADIGVNLFITGFASSSFQFLLIREIMNISGGYELITGIFLGTWLIVSAAGSSLAGRSQLMDLKKINLVFSLSPIASLFLIFLLTRLFLESGETPSVLASLLYTLLVLIPFCLASGFTFVRLISVARQFYGVIPGRSFSIETSGGIAAGILLSLIISGELGTYKLMFVIILLYIAYVVLTYFLVKPAIRISARIFFTLLISLIVLSEPDIFFRQILLPGIKIISSEDTPYGNITEGYYNGERSIYYNQRLLIYNYDVIEREEDIHYAMLQHDFPASVIMISGSLDSHLPEIMKYPVDKVVYIERDPALVRSVVADSLKDKVRISNSDAFSYIRHSKDRADVIIMLVHPPSTLLHNRNYTS
jgi:predicted membrane-bound spermidine synthase